MPGTSASQASEQLLEDYVVHDKMDTEGFIAEMDKRWKDKKRDPLV